MIEETVEEAIKWTAKEAKGLPIICVTGPMAAGKNTVSDRFYKKGYLVLDADCIVHHVVERMIEDIAREFSGEANKRGIQIIKDKKIDRRALGAMLFSSPALLARQERIILPEVEKAILKEIENANAQYKCYERGKVKDEKRQLEMDKEHREETGKKQEERVYKGIVLNAISLYKTKRLLPFLTLIVYVDAPFIVRLLRVIKRDKMPIRQILRRFHAQRGLYKEYKKTKVPIIIVNNC